MSQLLSQFKRVDKRADKDTQGKMNSMDFGDYQAERCTVGMDTWSVPDILKFHNDLNNDSGQYHVHSDNGLHYHYHDRGDVPENHNVPGNDQSIHNVQDVLDTDDVLCSTGFAICRILCLEVFLFFVV